MLEHETVTLILCCRYSYEDIQGTCINRTAIKTPKTNSCTRNSMYRRPARLRRGSVPGRRLAEDNEGACNPDTGIKFGCIIPFMLANSFMNSM